ncbi:cell division protein FtsL [Allopusillimonas soli]|uniref:Cell division protein FtsL n=1 Tax=Allopusillimonas soli TaxID=659016 RepID=A0A853FJ27_9BURK|nr:cell division protein FtsL [Allopusillimonas soli]NYT38750.1 cell division protein FtsL [Allopusillimonas soli]TEA70266.1 cell division protein FtsL [Allopusillimonas soli]
MGRLSLLFAVLLMLSALSLVTARFQARQLFVQAERLDDRARKLDTDWRRLQLERAELARNARIDGVARGDLHMMPASPDRTIYIQGEPLDSSAASQATAASGKGGRP